MSSKLGVVAIGRNEGVRLTRCLSALTAICETIVYVDSGSTDASVEAARERGVDVVELERNRPFTAARGRNAGFARLIEANPELEFIQFIDGDCELQPAWLAAARAYLESHDDVAAVAGRRRERAREASVYNRLADIEWNTAIGESGGFGGDVLLRAEVFRAVGGYDESLIAGEDPDLALRIRRAGHGVMRLDEEMTLHDADMHRFGEFWQRQVRGGHAYAERLALHGADGDAATLRSVLSIGFFGLVLPLGALSLAPLSLAFPLGALVLYAILWWRIYRRDETSDASAYATFSVIGKFAEAQGVLRFAWNRWIRRRPSALIEYKGPEVPKAPSR